jgi:hypothetical protein
MRNVQVTASWLLAALACACAGTVDDPSQFQASSSSAGATRNRDPIEEEKPEARDAGEPEPPPNTTLDAGGRASDAGSASVAPDGSGSAADRWPSDARASEAAASEPFEAGTADAADGSADAAASGAPDAAAACDFRGLIAAKCGNAGCHGAGAVASGLDLTSDKLATRIAGRKASDACASHLLIDTEQPEQSALYLKVTADACGSRMPLGGTLTDKEQMCILQWIENL